MTADYFLIIIYLYAAFVIVGVPLMVFPCLLRPTWWRVQWYRLVIVKCDVKIWLLIRAAILVMRASIEFHRFKLRMLS